MGQMPPKSLDGGEEGARQKCTLFAPEQREFFARQGVECTCGNARDHVIHSQCVCGTPLIPRLASPQFSEETLMTNTSFSMPLWNTLSQCPFLNTPFSVPRARCHFPPRENETMQKPFKRGERESNSKP
eukprot:800437-Rhodomonas_salina.1